MPDRFLLYRPATSETGPRLANYLGIPSGTSMPGSRQDYLIRWGTSERIDYIPNEQTWNLRTAVAQNTDKLQSLQMMEEAGVNVPPYSRDWRDLSFPMFGRSSNHSGGSDIDILIDEHDARQSASDFYTGRVPIRTEYRVHVIRGEVVKISEKEKREGPDGREARWIRNYENGWRFVYPDDEPAGLHQAVPALEAMNLHFGAVDMVIGTDGQPYVLEINTAPSLDPPSLEVYGERLAEMVEVDNHPGLDAVEYPDDEEEIDEADDGGRMGRLFG